MQVLNFYLKQGFKLYREKRKDTYPILDAAIRHCNTYINALAMYIHVKWDP